MVRNICHPTPFFKILSICQLVFLFHATGKYFLDEIKGLADAAGFDYKVSVAIGILSLTFHHFKSVYISIINNDHFFCSIKAYVLKHTT